MIEKRRLETAKKVAQSRINELQRRLDQGDFSKREKKTPVTDSELVDLNAQKIRLKEEYKKEFQRLKRLVGSSCAA